MTDLSIAFEDPLSKSFTPPTQQAGGKDVPSDAGYLIGRMSQYGPAPVLYNGTRSLSLSDVTWKILSVDRPTTVKMVVPGLFLGFASRSVKEEDPGLGNYARFTPSAPTTATSLVCNLLIGATEYKQIRRIWKYMCYLRETGTPEWDGYEGNPQLLPQWATVLATADVESTETPAPPSWLLSIPVDPSVATTMMTGRTPMVPCTTVNAVVQVADGGQRLSLVGNSASSNADVMFKINSFIMEHKQSYTAS